jgi:limonene-1,2-epoxide hydrolase
VRGVPADVVSRFIAAIERKDIDHALNHLTDDCVYDNVPMGAVTGRDAVRAVLGPFLEPCTQIEWVIHHQVAEGTLDSGVVMNERLDRFLMGARWIELPVAGLFVIRHGQISLWRDYFDRDSFTKQLATDGTGAVTPSA